MFHVLVCLEFKYTALTCSSLVFPFLFKDAFPYGLKPPFIINGIYLYEDLGISLTFDFFILGWGGCIALSSSLG